jgi:hypothetical protein
MTNQAILAAIDEEIIKLQQARAMLSDSTAGPTSVKKSVGRPKGSKSAASVPAPKKRTISAEGKARIAAGQKKRWAVAKKAAK